MIRPALWGVTFAAAGGLFFAVLPWWAAVLAAVALGVVSVFVDRWLDRSRR